MGQRGLSPRPLRAVERLLTPALARPAVAGWTGDGTALFFAPGDWRRPDDSAEPARPPRSRHAAFWTWAVVALLVTSLVLPFSLAAMVDLVRYLRR